MLALERKAFTAKANADEATRRADVTEAELERRDRVAAEQVSDVAT